VPVPRRFDRRPPERDSTRVNDRIRVPEVRVIGEDGSQIGVMRTDEALRYAQERDLDLVEVAPEARPPVCRVLDYSKYKYEQAQKQKSARKHQQRIIIREIKFRPKIGEHDYATKKGHVERFLRAKHKVKITIMFRGRETTHPERGSMILERLAEELGALATIEQRPNLEGRNMTMLLGPSKAVMNGTIDAELAAAEAAAADAAADAADEAVRAGGPPAAQAAPADAQAARADAPADADGSEEAAAAEPAGAEAAPEADAEADPAPNNDVADADEDDEADDTDAALAEEATASPSPPSAAA
jgi:translation initiation factor IF-3